MAGRPRSFDRDAALDCAMHAFWRDGYANTSVASLTAAMRINPPSLYAAFGDKEQLFDEAAGRYVAVLRAAVSDSLGAPTAQAAVGSLLELTAVAQGDPDSPPGCLVFSEPRMAGERDWVRGVIARRLEQGLADGDLPAGTDIAALAGYVEAVIAGMSARAREGRAGYEELAAIGRVAAAAIPRRLPDAVPG